MATTERALICAACPERQGSIRCGLGGTLAQRITSGKCPMGSFPDSRGVVRWLGIEWFGVPAPLRWLAATRLGRAMMGGIPKPRPLPQCGCIVALKVAVQRPSRNQHIRKYPAEPPALMPPDMGIE